MTGATCWLSAARLACMFCVIASVAAAPLAVLLAVSFAVLFANGAEALGVATAAAAIAGRCAASFGARLVVVALLVEEESSAPQPFNAIVASTSDAALAMQLIFLMSASGSMKAGAVSIPFKK
ncbi:hypothetical protein OKW26_000924 [Paraburkholderia sp. 32]